MIANRHIGAILLALLSQPFTAAKGAIPDISYDITQELNRISPAIDTRTCTISPDMKVAAIVITSKPNERGYESKRLPEGFPVGLATARIEIVNLATHKREDLPERFGVCFGPAWSPDSERLAFFSCETGELQLSIWDRATGIYRTISGLFLSPNIWDLPTWSPDGNRILACSCQKPQLSTERNRLIIEASTPQRPTPAKHSESILCSVDVKTGAITSIVSINGLCRWRDYSPSGQSIGIIDDKYLRVFNIKSKVASIIATKSAGEISALGPNNCSWSPSGESIAYVTYPRRDLWVAFTDGQPPVCLVKSGETTFDPDTNTHDAITAPVWLSDLRIVTVIGGAVYVADPNRKENSCRIAPKGHSIIDILTSTGHRRSVLAGTKTILVATRDNNSDKVGFGRVDLVTGGLIILKEARASDDRRRLGTWYTDLSIDEKKLIYIEEKGDQPPDFVVADCDLESSDALTNLNPALANVGFSESHSVNFVSANGDRVDGTLILPKNWVSGSRVPLIVTVEPGLAEGHGHLNDFGLRENGPFNVQLLASRGYAIFRPAIPASIEDCARYVLPAIFSLIDAGIVEPHSIGIIGVGKGSVSAIEVLMSSEIFKAAVVSSGPFETLTRPDLFLKGASILALDRVRTPLLMLVGTEDHLQSSQAESVFYYLQRLRREATIVEYPGEIKGPGNWSFEDQVDCSTRMLAWLGNHMPRTPVVPLVDRFPNEGIRK